MQRYSIAALAWHALGRHRGWTPLWRKAAPRPHYRVVIIGGGGHGLATAYYLAKEHGISDVAVLEKGAIGLGNTGRNTTIIRSNYLWDESARIYEHSLKLWEGLSTELNFNLMLSQRGVLNLAHTESDLREGMRRVNANRLNGIDAEWLDAAAVKRFCPILNVSADARYPLLGATLQRRGGVARHDAVAWGYARAADARGIDIVENCEVTAIRTAQGRVTGVETSRGEIAADKVAIAAAGHSSMLAAMAGVRLPLQSHPLQALVSEPIKPVLDCVVMSNTVHVYVSQSDKGELVIGAGIDAFNSYAQRGSFHVIEGQIAALLELFPVFSRLKMLRGWAGIVDVSPDASPIIGKLPVEGLYLNGGAPVGSRRPPAPAMSSPTRSRRTSRTRWPGPSPSNASRAAR
jgi:sarcosine oxidase subunit beta